MKPLLKNALKGIRNTLLLAALGGVTVLPAQAGQRSATMAVSVTILPACTIATGAGVPSLRCNGNTAYEWTRSTTRVGAQTAEEQLWLREAAADGNPAEAALATIGTADGPIQTLTVRY